MSTLDFTRCLLADQSVADVFNAVTDVRGWWSESIEGGTKVRDDEFVYRFRDLHYSKQKLIEVIPGKRVVWLVTDSNLSFTVDKQEWTGTSVEFDITQEGNRTRLNFTHRGLTPGLECHGACTKGWAQYTDSLFSLITTGKGQPDKMMSTKEIAARFYELAKAENWFGIQDELFSEEVESVEPSTSRYLQNARGKAAVRKKGEEWVSKVEAFYSGHTTAPVIGGAFFAVGRTMDISVRGAGRLAIDELMVYEVRDGRIVREQFFY